MLLALCIIKLALLIPGGGGLIQSSTNRRPRLQDVTSPYYLALPAAVKADRIWSNCLADTRPARWYNPLEVLALGATESMCPTYFTPGDELRSGRKKIIHNVGVVGRVKWIDRGGHPYTGIFKGASHGIVRLAHSAEPTTVPPGSIVFNPRPGMGLKFLRNGMDSANLVAMFSVNGQRSWNFFKNDWTTHLPQPLAYLRATLGTLKFATATRNILQVGISDWGKAGEDGKVEHYANAPYRLRFKPAPDVAHRFSDDLQDKCQIENYCELRTIKAGTTLFHVFAADKPKELGGKEQLIGDVILTSHLSTSRWGDNGLLFRHQLPEEDIRLHPEWNKYTPQEGLLSSSSKFPSSPFRTPSCRAGGVRQLVACPLGPNVLGGC